MPEARLKLTPKELDPYLRSLSPARQHSSRRYRYGVKDDEAVLDTVVVLKLMVEDWLERHTKLNEDQSLAIMMEIDFQPVADAFEARDFSKRYHLALHDWKYASLPNVHEKFLQLGEVFPWVDSLPAPAVTIMACDLMALLGALEATHARIANPIRPSVPDAIQAPPEQ
jgi:hypothetical protein